jgi:hypothetical protein
MKPPDKDSIVLVDYDGGHTRFYGSLEKALRFFNSNNDYWKILINGLVYIQR